ncbi:hypothetical protein EC957_001970 [Mortierella hygrophila]|uniref:Uncharacterized protein n=1 Tax=Mortierella hygrophila TaxID=979708 RepID=A0A9P6F5G2_9FUNG|nr:hypothetical protein EC957_001970 [Mortierella hygrophila]
MLSRGRGTESAKHPPPGTEGDGNLLGSGHLNDDDDGEDDCRRCSDKDEVKDDKDPFLLGSKELCCGGGIKIVAPPGVEDDRIAEGGEEDVKGSGGCWGSRTDDEDDEDERWLLELGPDAGDSGELMQNTDMDNGWALAALEMTAAVSEEKGDEIS